MKKSFYVGIDVSKRTIDVAYYDKGPVYLGCFENCDEGFVKMLRELKNVTGKRVSQWFVCFENTGVYSKPLFSYLSYHNIACREENALHLSRSLGMKRAKDDQIDARDICRYAFEKRDSIQASKPLSNQITRLRKLVNYRDLLIRKKTSLKLSLSEQKKTMDEQLYAQLMEGNKAIVKHFNQEIKRVEQLMQATIDEQKETKRNDQLARSVMGVGPIISAFMIAYSNNYTCFKSARPFASYCAIAPFPHSSGTSIKKPKRTNHLGHKKLRSALSNAASSAIKSDPEIRQYFNRKKQEGKHSGVIINAIKNKLIHRVFAVIKRQSPYVKLNNYA